MMMLLGFMCGTFFVVFIFGLVDIKHTNNKFRWVPAAIGLMGMVVMFGLFYFLCK